MSSIRQKDKTVAVLLCLFFGGLGGHKFYLDRPVAGIFYLLFCWTFIPAFIAFIDLIRLAFMNQVLFDQTYNGK